MKIGVMIGPERGDTSRKVKRLLEEIACAEAAGFPTALIASKNRTREVIAAISADFRDTAEPAAGDAVGRA